MNELDEWVATVKQAAFDRDAEMAAKGLTKCVWCGKYRKVWSGWEQETLRDGWKPLCSGCGSRRLNNPWNALLRLRKVEEALKP